jgi:intergrase/recombinase
MPPLNGLKKAIMRSSLSMRIKYCRKIHASWLHHKGISSDLIDTLQGRISKNTFLRHYLTPSADYKKSILDAITDLQQQIHNSSKNSK